MNLKIDTPAKQIADYLVSINLLEKIPGICSTEKPGEGNMNLVLRFKCDEKSLILKQSKPFVNKYPDIPAPEERIHTEAQYFKYANNITAIKKDMPNVLFYDPANHLMVMEDLGEGSDFLYLYKKGSQLKNKELEFLSTHLCHLHQFNWMENEINNFPKNQKLRELNHQHIFVLPFLKKNGFDLDGIQDGLKDLSIKYTSDDFLKKEAKKLGDIYLSNGSNLIHGDYYPGSWIRTDNGIKIIDPEFGFMGCREFDLGVFTAHLIMCGHTLNTITDIFTLHYKINGNYDMKLVRNFAVIEVFRRIIGIAQLPLELSVEEKSDLLERIYKWL